MEKRTLEFNLAELDEKSLIRMLKENKADFPELMGLLEGLFQMWSSALKFSSTVVQYGESQYPDFLAEFIKHAAPHHGIAPERLAQLVEYVSQKHFNHSRLH